MRKEFFAGRTVLKKLFTDFFSDLIEEEKDSRSFLSFGKQREQVNLSPRIILFSGENGLGKSSALKTCISLADDIAKDAKKEVKVVSFDCEEWYFREGRLPVSVEELMNALFKTATDKSLGLSHHFSRYTDINKKIKKLNSSIEDIISEEWARELFLEPVSLDTSETQLDCELWARKQLPRHDSEFIEKSESKLVEALVSSFNEAAANCPLIFLLDSVELLDNNLKQWLYKVFFPSLFEHKNRILSFVSGSNDVLRGFRNTFPEVFLFNFDFKNFTLSKHEITDIASKLYITTSESDIERIEAYSAGIPIVVHDIFDYADKKFTFDTIFTASYSDLSKIDTLAQDILQRFFTNTENPNATGRVFHLCMCNQFTPALLAKLWNVPFAEINNCINELSSICSFVKNKRVHPLLRSCLRSFLLHETTRGIDSSYNEFFNAFSKTSFDYYQEQLFQLTTTLPTMEKRYNDDRYCSLIINMITNMLWTSPDEAFGLLPGLYLEMIHFNTNCAKEMMRQLEEFQPILPTNFQDILAILKKGILTASSQIFRNRTPVSDSERDVLAYITDCTALLNDEQKALLYHSLGRIDFRTNQYENALTNFKLALSSIEKLENGKSLIFEDFLMLGYGFLSHSKPEPAIESFSEALRTRPDSFLPWFDLGEAYMEMNNYKDAVDSLNQAVAINPDHHEAWYNLGMCNSRLNNHALAVQSFAKAVEKGPQSATLWFEMGLSFQQLNQYEEAVKSYGKVVGIDSQNAEAWYLMGKSNTALSISQEAVTSYIKAIELREDYYEAIDALGMEYTTMNKFSDAAETLEKAIALQPENPDLYYRISVAWYKADKYENAISAGAKAVEYNPQLADAWTVIGRSYTAVSNFQKALESYSKAVEIDHENAEIWNEIGNSHYALCNYDEAIDAFEKAVAVDPMHRGTWYNIGLAYQIQDRYDNAVEAFTNAVEIQPDDMESWFQKGRVHMILEQYEQAIEAFSKTVELRPDSHDAWYRRGFSYAKTQAHKEAIDSFEQAVKLWNSDADIWYNLGLSYAAITLHKEAVNAFTEANSLAPSRFEFHHHLGVSLHALKKYDEAINAYSKALELQPDKTDTVNQMGQCLHQLRRFEEARICFLKVIEVDTENTDTLYLLAHTCHALESYEEAICYYRQVTTAKPDFIEAWFNTAVAFHAMGSYADAIDVYVKIVYDEPDHAVAWYNLGTAYHAMGEFKNAIRSYRESTKIDPEKAEIWYQMGVAYYSLEQFGEAIQAYRKVVQIDPTHVEAFFNCGLSYYIWNHYEDAIDSFKKAIELQPDHSGALSNLVLAYFDSGNFENASTYGEQSLSLKPDEIWLYTYLISSYAMLGNVKRASERLDTLILLDADGQYVGRTHYLLKKSLSKKSVTEAENILQRLDEERNIHEYPDSGTSVQEHF